MTLIAFATYGDSATIVTDSLAYTGGGRRMAHCSKVLGLPHVDAALITQGDSLFGDMAKIAAMSHGMDMPSSDDLAEALSRELPKAWAEVPKREGIEATVYLVGYSPAREAFAAWTFAAEHDFRAEVSDGPLIVPCPITYRPSEVEAARLAKTQDEELLAEWLQEEPVPTPQTAQDWLELAMAARITRACAGEAKTFVGGGLYLTEVFRGGQQTRKVYEFDDSGEEFREMVRGTLHPLSLAGDCICGSGEQFLDCCLAEDLDKTCECGSGTDLRKCCAAEALSDLPATA